MNRNFHRDTYYCNLHSFSQARTDDILNLPAWLLIFKMTFEAKVSSDDPSFDRNDDLFASVTTCKHHSVLEHCLRLLDMPWKYSRNNFVRGPD